MIHNPEHPIWGITRLLIVMTALVVTLWLNASNFDETELKTIITMFIVAAGAEGATGFISRFTKNDKNEKK